MVEKIGRIQLVDGADTCLGSRLLGSWLASAHLHVGHALGDASNARRGSSAVVGRREALDAGSRRAIWLLRGRVASGRLLCVLSRVASVARLKGLRSAKLASSWQLTAYCRIAASSHVECAGSVVSLLLFASSDFCTCRTCGGRRRGSWVLVGLAIVGLLVGDLALTVVVGCGHDGRRKRRVDTLLSFNRAGLRGMGLAVSRWAAGPEVWRKE